MSLGRRVAGGLAAIVAAAWLTACTTQPSTGDVDGSTQVRLRPLVKQLAVPPGAPPRSQVPSVRYDLAVSGTGESPDDGVPGDEGPREIFERGGASWYGIQFHQRKTASGERFDMTEFTAAHKTLPFNTRVCVRSLVNGREVLVRINDRGPYTSGRIIDLSRAAAESIGLLGLGIKQVALHIVDKETDRCGGTVVGAADVPAAAEPAPQSKSVRKVAPRKGK